MTSRTETQAIAVPNVTRRRQHAGTACDECRRRKLRCDGQQPKCGICQESGLICEVSERGARGPKKGYMKALKNKIMYLEAMLESHLSAKQGSSESISDLMLSMPPVEVSSVAAVDSAQSLLPAANVSVPEPESFSLSGTFSELSSFPEWSPTSVLLPNIHVMQAELDQLYFDRVHPSIPILHQRRYLSWSRGSKTPARGCLQFAMWTLASLQSTQFSDVTESLYREAKQMLEFLSADGDGYSGCGTELVQAWVLVAICESMRTNHRQAWMSAGSVFRLLQAMCFHEIDNPKKIHNVSLPLNSDFIETEEKRRVFWMGYFLDHVFSIRNDWPVTLNEHMICTRLPARDEDFQSGQQVLGPFLSEAMTAPNLNVRSPFNECLILATICGRSLLRNQQYSISKAYGDTSSDWVDQSRWLDNILTAHCYSTPTEAYDPLLLFANVLGQAVIIYYCKGMMELVADSADIIEEYRHRALTAVEAIIRLAKAFSQLHFSKVHPLMPIPLFLSAEFLYDNLSANENFALRLQELVDVFHQLKNVNNHEQSYIDLLPRSCVSKTAELQSHTTKSTIH